METEFINNGGTLRIIETEIKGVVIVEPVVHYDKRGYFVETYQKQKLEKLGMKYNFVQDNQSFSSHAGTVRGLHYQSNPKSMTKLVKVLHGAIYDVAVDIRIGSPTFGKYVGTTLTGQNQRQLLIPKGFAHGLCTLTPDTVVSYKIDEFYDASLDCVVAWDDPDISIDWPISSPIISDKDKSAPRLKDTKINFFFKEGLNDTFI